MLKIQTKEVSPDLKAERHERDAILGERNNIQVEMISLGEVNNRIKSEIKTLEKEKQEMLEDADIIKESINSLAELKSEKQQEIKNLDKEYEDKKKELESKLPDVDAVLADLEFKKLPIQNEIARFSSIQVESQKSLESVNNKINDSKKILSDLSLSIEHNTFRESLLRKSIEKKEAELIKLEEQVSKNQAIVSGIEKRGIILAQINKDIEEAENKFILRRGEIKKFLEVESEELKNEIEKNKAINEQEKALHISLLSKKQILDNKEAYIKNQYIRAGLKYE